MEEMKIGRFIRDQRLRLEMTQQQLADKLGVTDKAVSKWERSISYPDITILRELADALEVSVTELLAGELEETPIVAAEVQDVVLDTVRYAETARRRNEGWRYWTFVVLSILCLIAALVLLIIHWVSGDGNCLRAVQSVAFGWAVCYPLLRTEKHPVRNAMVIASLAVYPFIFIIGERSAHSLGIVIVSVAYAWTVYALFLRYRREKGKLTFLILLLGGLLHVSINILVYQWGLANVLRIVFLTLAAGAGCLWAAYMIEIISARARTKEYRKE